MKVLVCLFVFLFSADVCAHVSGSADLNGDGLVNVADFLLFVDQFGGPAREQAAKEVPGLAAIALRGESIFAPDLSWIDSDDDDTDDTLLVPVYFQDADGRYLDIPDNFSIEVSVKISTDNDRDRLPDLPHVYDDIVPLYNYCDDNRHLVYALVALSDIRVTPGEDYDYGYVTVQVTTSRNIPGAHAHAYIPQVARRVISAHRHYILVAPLTLPPPVLYIIRQKGGVMREQSVKVRLTDAEYWYLRRFSDAEGASMPGFLRQLLHDHIIIYEGSAATTRPQNSVPST